MKKDLVFEILKQMSVQRRITFVDVDMSAAHTRIARYLLSKEDSQLDKALKDEAFWSTQIQGEPLFFKVEPSNFRKNDQKNFESWFVYVIKLNGGNPVSTERLVENLPLNARNSLENAKFKSLNDLKEDSIFLAATRALENFALVDEGKEINTTCSENDSGRIFTHTIDRIKPYEVESPRLGISRVLQGFEIVLLSVLVRSLLF